jgi:hypothetical protein
LRHIPRRPAEVVDRLESRRTVADDAEGTDDAGLPVGHDEVSGRWEVTVILLVHDLLGVAELLEEDRADERLGGRGERMLGADELELERLFHEHLRL